MDDGQSLQRPARHRLLSVPPDLRLRHARIVLERQRGDVLAAFAAAADAAKTYDSADIEIAVLNPNGEGDRHRGCVTSPRRVPHTVPTWLASPLAAGHRREEGDLARAGDCGIRLDMGVVDRRADDLWGL